MERLQADPASHKWLDIAVILDSSAPAAWVQAIFDAVANRPLPLPDANRVARRIDLITCAGLKPLHPQYGHGLRLYDAGRLLSVADAIDDCAQTDPPPEVLVLISDRAPTGQWVQAMAAWTRQLRLRGRTPVREHLVWGDHLADLDGFALAPQEVASIGELQAALARLWQRDMPVLKRPSDKSRARHCPPRRRVVNILKPFADDELADTTKLRDPEESTASAAGNCAPWEASIQCSLPPVAALDLPDASFAQPLDTKKEL